MTRSDGVVIFPYGGQVFHRAGKGPDLRPGVNEPESFDPTEWAHPACGIPRRPGRVAIRALAEESGRRPCRRCYPQ